MFKESNADNCENVGLVAKELPQFFCEDEDEGFSGVSFIAIQRKK